MSMFRKSVSVFDKNMLRRESERVLIAWVIDPSGTRSYGARLRLDDKRISGKSRSSLPDEQRASAGHPALAMMSF